MVQLELLLVAFPARPSDKSFVVMPWPAPTEWPGLIVSA